jgi:hypothetical protein
MRARLLAVALGMLIVACGSAAGSGGSDPPPPPAETVTLTRADNQRTVTAHVGDHIQVALGDDINWELEPPDGSVLVRESLRNYLLVRGTQAIWLAQSAGRSTIKASGGMNCPSGAACPLMLALFTATVQVDP